MPRVSVIVPVYQVERYIHQTIESVLKQTYTDFELLVIDDQGSDRSVEICRSFADPRIKVISNPQNRGLAGARNSGIRHAQGEYLGFLDGDDLWQPAKLEKHVAHLDQHPEVGVSFSCSAFIDEAGKLLGNYQTPKLQDITPAQIICRNPISNGSVPVIRRQVFTGIEFQDNRYGEVENFYFDENFRQSEDIECWVRIALQTPWQVEGIPDVLTLYRVNSEGLSANVFNQLAAWEKMITKTRIYAPEFIARWEHLARAYQLRYLARRAVRMKDGATAVKLLHKALRTKWQICVQEPQRTLTTAIAAYLLWGLPPNFYSWLENLALQTAGTLQKKRIGVEAKKVLI
jgi:glycosyltransferase involved in cell wall biosynthesis